MDKLSVVPLVLHNSDWDFPPDPNEVIPLPFDVGHGLWVEDVRAMLEGELELWKNDSSVKDKVQRVRYGLVERRSANSTLDNLPIDEQNKTLNLAAACLRIIRPTREYIALIHGEPRTSGTLDVRHLSWFFDFEVPENQKLFDVRLRDLQLLKILLPQFIAVYSDEVSKFHMAVQFYNAAHTEAGFWKARYILWMCSIEALFTSNSSEHMGSLVAKERIKWFLGANFRLYDEGDLVEQEPRCEKTVSDVLDDLYTLRNLIAHGDRVPDAFMHTRFRDSTFARDGVNLIGGLFESLSKIIRACLIKILRENLYVHFRTREAAEAFFTAEGLVKSELRKSSKTTGAS